MTYIKTVISMKWKYDESDEGYRNLERPSTNYIDRYLFKSFQSMHKHLRPNLQYYVVML